MMIKNGRHITLPFPPSVNHYWIHFTAGKMVRMVVGKKGKEFREEVKRLTSHIAPIEGRLSVEIYAVMPDKRKRDLDNLCKPTIDALMEAGLYEDDSQIDRLLIVREKAIIKGGALEVYIEEIPSGSIN